MEDKPGTDASPFTPIVKNSGDMLIAYSTLPGKHSSLFYLLFLSLLNEYISINYRCFFISLLEWFFCVYQKIIFLLIMISKLYIKFDKSHFIELYIERFLENSFD